MPQVIAHTAVIQAYADAGKPKDALKVFERMLACGVLPNAYTYSVLVNCLAGSGEWKMVKEGVKWFCEMMGKGIRPNAETCVALFEGVVKCGKMEEGRELVRKMKGFGFQVDEKGVREVIKGILLTYINAALWAEGIGRLDEEWKKINAEKEED
ncbi:pentatricopeptide repeat-containing protein [Tanacetum coccineum]